MNDVKTQARVTALIAVLSEREQAKSRSNPEDNPFASHTLVDLSHGLMKGADNMPALNMAAKAPKDPLAYDLEHSRIEVAEAGRADKSARRMAQAKARAERKVEFDRIAESAVVPDPDKMQRAWLVVVHLVPIIVTISKSKQRWANRLLGSNADDIPQMALEKTAMVLAKQSKFDLDVLAVAAEQLGISQRKVPGDQAAPLVTDSDQVKQVKKARKWLMGMVNNRVMGALVDSYTNQNNLRWDNLDIIATVMASINGVGDDAMLNRFKADRAPAFLGTRFPAPGGIDGNLLAMAVAAAITEHRLDVMVEFLLDDEHRTVNGAVKWTECAEALFKLTPGGYGGWLWDQVVANTAGHARAENARGIAAMKHVRNLFEWLPGMIVDTVESFDFQFRSWSQTNMGKALLSSDFEGYLPEADGTLRGKRYPLTPALRYDTVLDAALALTEHLACLTTGNDLVASAVNA